MYWKIWEEKFPSHIQFTLGRNFFYQSSLKNSYAVRMAVPGISEV